MSSYRVMVVIGCPVHVRFREEDSIFQESFKGLYTGVIVFIDRGFSVKGATTILGYYPEYVFLFPCGVRKGGLVDEKVRCWREVVCVRVFQWKSGV